MGIAGGALTPERLLTQHHLLGTLGDADRAALLARSRIVRFPAGAVVFHRDDPGDGLYGVLEGRIFVSVVSEAGKELILNEFSPGAFFGEIALLDGGGRTATAAAREPSTLLFVSRSAFLPFIEARPRVAIRMIALLCDRLRRTTRLVEDSIFLTVPTRLARGLLARADGEGTIVASQAELAQTLGVSREIVSRQLSIWREAGFVSLGRGRIKLVARSSIEGLAEGG